MTTHELDCPAPLCAQIARGERTLYAGLDTSVASGDTLHLAETVDHRPTGRHVCARVVEVARPVDWSDHVRPYSVVMLLELYRTRVDGQAGPGDWSQDVPPEQV